MHLFTTLLSQLWCNPPYTDIYNYVNMHIHWVLKQSKVMHLYWSLMKRKAILITRQLENDSQSCGTMFNSLLHGGTAVSLSSHSCSAALLQLSLRNCCRCFCCINLSYPPRKLSNKTIQRGPQRVQNSDIKWQGSEMTFFSRNAWHAFEQTFFAARRIKHVENIHRSSVLGLAVFVMLLKSRHCFFL